MTVLIYVLGYLAFALPVGVLVGKFIARGSQ